MLSTRNLFIYSYIVTFLFFLTGTVYAAPRLHSASLTQGSGMARSNNCPAVLNWNIENPDNSSAEISLQLEPDGGTSTAIYTKRVILPAQTSLSGSSAVFIDTAERYIVSLIHNNLRVDKTDILIRPQGANLLKIALLSDAESLTGYSTIAKDLTLGRRMQFSTIRKGQAAQHHSAYAQFNMMILFEPELKHYSALQKRAILDYCRNGGYLLIGGAETAFRMENSALKELLPVVPVSITEKENFNIVRNAFMLPEISFQERDSNGDLLEKDSYKILEALALPGTTKISEQTDRCLIFFGQNGLGRVTLLGFNPFIISHQDDELRSKIWSMVIAHSFHLPINMSQDKISRLNETLQLLQGYVIPPVSVVLKIFLFYLLIAVLILFVSFHYKKQAVGWLILCIVSVFYTMFIFKKAESIVKNQPKRSFTAVTSTLWDGNYGSQNGTASLFVKADCRPTLKAKLIDNYIMPTAKSRDYEGGTALTASPLHITDDTKYSSLEKIALQQYRPRVFSWCRSSLNHGANPAELPVLNIEENDLRLEEWEIPENFKNINRAVLLLPNELINLSINANKISGSQRRFDALETDLLFTAACKYLSALRIPNPTLCLVTNNRNKESKIFNITNGKETFEESQFHFDLIPVNVKNKNKKTHINNAFITIDFPLRTPFRQHFRDGEFLDIMIQPGTNVSYPLEFNVHPAIQGFNAEEIIFNLEISNPSARASFELFLVDKNNQEIAPEKTEGSSYHFKVKPDIIDPFTNKIKVRLQANYRSDDSVISQRVNTWKINSCKVNIIAEDLNFIEDEG